jgi:mono/diheme cytochrome c family protein
VRLPLAHGTRLSVASVGLATALVASAGFGYSGWSARRDKLARGERLYHEQSCVVCHGESGRGDGARSRALSPPPRDFRALDAYVQGTTAPEIARTLETGVKVHPSPMPSFSHLSDGERLTLAEFVVSLQ